MLIYQNENVGKSFDFRCRYHNGFLVAPHIHEFSELVFVLNGTMTMYIDGKKTLVNKGQLALIFPNRIHAYTKETECQVWCAVFSNDFVYSFFQLNPNKIPVDPVIELSDDTFVMNKLMNCDHSDTVFTSGLLHLLFAKLLEQTALKDNPSNGATVYKAALDYISRNFRGNITLKEMAKKLGYHEKYLSAALNELTGMNFRNFLATYRVDYAKNMLRTTEKNICEIALESGFASINTFNRVFKSFTGLTPSEFKAQRP